jgi:hypothetical protein
LAGNGIPVFPCKADKSPLTAKGFKDASADPAQIDAWWSKGDWNIGVRPWDMGLVALDLDHYKPGGVSAAFQEILPLTRTHLTPHGGEQRFYKAPEAFGNSGAAQNVDVRCAKGYVLWPPSIVDGVEYKVIDACEPVALPEVVANTLRAKATEVDDADECPDIGLDIDVGGARRYLQRLCDSDGHPGRFQLACALVRNFGLSNATATALCQENEIRIEPLHSGQSWEQKVANARKHGTGQLGEGVAFQVPEGDGRADTFDAFVPAPEIKKSRFRLRQPAEAANKGHVPVDVENVR